MIVKSHPSHMSEQHEVDIAVDLKNLRHALVAQHQLAAVETHFVNDSDWQTSRLHMIGKHEPCTPPSKLVYLKTCLAGISDARDNQLSNFCIFDLCPKRVSSHPIHPRGQQSAVLRDHLQQRSTICG